MKAYVWIAGMMCIAGLASAAEPAGAPDAPVCRGSYPVLLMTEMECRLYSHQVQLLQARGNHEALAALKVQHDKLLGERAAACPCARQHSVSDQSIVVAGDC